MRLFRAKPTGKTHDFTNQCWGHALHLDNVVSVRRQILSGSLHHWTPVRAGDDLVWLAEGNRRVTGRVTKAEGTSTVRDMYFVTVRIIGAEDPS